MFLFLLDLQKWRDQGPPGHPGVRAGHRGSLEPATGSSLPGTAGKGSGGAPQQSRIHPCPSTHYLAVAMREGGGLPHQDVTVQWQPAKLRHLCILSTQRHPKMYLSGHCHWKVSGLFLEGRTCLFLLLSKMVRIHKAGMGIGWERNMREKQEKGGEEELSKEKRQRRMGWGRGGERPFYLPPTARIKHVWRYSLAFTGDTASIIPAAQTSRATEIL